MANTTKLVNLGMTTVALLLGAAVVVLLTLESIDVTTAVSMLGIGLAALALASIDLHSGPA